MTTPVRVGIVDEVSAHVALGVMQFRDLRVDAGVAGPVPALPDSAVVADRIAMVRAMYRRIGIDPTKTRPSSEALLRRVRRGQPWPRINSLVDVCNDCSLAVQLPFGLYDREHIVGDVILRHGRPGEQYEGIRKAVVHLHGRPVLVDQIGPFGNPTSDSARTMVTLATREALVVVFAPKALDGSVLDEVLEFAAAAVKGATGGLEQSRSIASGSAETTRGVAPARAVLSSGAGPEPARPKPGPEAQEP